MERIEELFTETNFPNNPLAPYRCYHCGGRGEFIGHSGVMVGCAVCNRRGRIKACPVCYISPSTSCRRCKGRGVIPD